jgi:hypothetical protein
MLRGEEATELISLTLHLRPILLHLSHSVEIGARPEGLLRFLNERWQSPHCREHLLQELLLLCRLCLPNLSGVLAIFDHIGTVFEDLPGTEIVVRVNGIEFWLRAHSLIAELAVESSNKIFTTLFGAI